VIRRHHIDVLCVVETRIKEVNAERIRDVIIPGWELVHNYSTHWLGRIWLCWDPGLISAKVVSIHEQVVTCCFEDSNCNVAWFLSVVYGATKGIPRREMMNELVAVKSLVGNFPWLLTGDFNVIRYQHEKWKPNILNNYEIEFCDCIARLEVEDLAYSGCFHTWNNKQDGDHFVSKKLDRVLSNFCWLQKFPHTVVEFLEGGISDHSPALISVEQYVS